MSRPFTPHVFGRYELVHRLATGGMAEVYVAVMRGAAGFSKRVALKRILPFFCDDPGFVTMFQDEARVASTLNHANVAQVFEFGEVDGSYYLTMELVEGLDLARVVERLAAAGQPMPVATAAFVIAEAARGLAYAHERRGDDGQPIGLVHRDVSPQNLLVSRAGEIKITDFGIAKAAGQSHKTATGVVMGKLRYMSPEQIGGRPLDGKSDVFSLGVVLYELVTAGPIFPGEDSVRLAELIHTGEIPPPSTRQPAIPPELDRLVLAALDRDPTRRPSASTLARELSVFVNQHASGFTREDLAGLVASIFTDEDDHGRRTFSSPVAFLPTEAGTPVGPRLTQPGTPEPVWLGGSGATPSGTGIARARAEERTPSAWGGSPPPSTMLPRALDVATRTRHEDVTSPEDGQDSHARGGDDRARPRRGTELWVGVGLAGVILISGAFVGWRLLGGAGARSAGIDAASAVTPDARAVALRGDAARTSAMPDAAPGSMTPPPLDEVRRRGLLAAVARERVARRGVASSADYRAFVSALDWHVARLEVAPDGHLERGEALPPALAEAVMREGVGPAVDATLAYVMAAGTLPPDVASALAALRRQAGVLRRGAEGYAAGALASLLDAGDAEALAAAAQATLVLGTPCRPTPPRRAWHPELCDPEAARAALEGQDPGHAAVAPLARWLDAAPATDVQASWSTELAGSSVLLEVRGVTGEVTLAAGGLAGAIAPAPEAAPDGGAGRIVFRLPVGAWAPVLLVASPQATVRLGPSGRL